MPRSLLALLYFHDAKKGNHDAYAYPEECLTYYESYKIGSFICSTVEKQFDLFDPKHYQKWGEDFGVSKQGHESPNCNGAAMALAVSPNLGELNRLRFTGPDLGALQRMLPVLSEQFKHLEAVIEKVLLSRKAQVVNEEKDTEKDAKCLIM